jgi:hypothetical protein
MPTWTPMNNLATGDLVTESDMDALRGNLDYLLDPNKSALLDTAGSIYSTTSTTFVDISATNLSISLTTHGGPVLVIFSGSMYAGTSSTRVWLDITVDGSRHSGTSYGLLQVVGLGTAIADTRPICMVALLTGLAAGTYTLRPQWAVSAGGTVWMLSNASTCPVQFSAIEL